MPDGVDFSIPASLMMNLTCVVGQFSGRLGLDRPPMSGKAEPKSKKVLLYGGSTSFGSLSVQYLSQAGYAVITTSSPRNRAFVETLGANVVFDHTQEPEALVEQIKTHGPFDVVVDFVSIPSTVAINGAVLAAQGGGKLYTMQPGREELPEGVERMFEPYSESLYEAKNKELLEWTVETYLPEGIKNGLIKSLPVEKAPGGLNGIDEALKKVFKGDGRWVVDPWE